MKGNWSPVSTLIPKYRSTLYTGRILQCYIVFSLVLLILLMFYAMFLIMAVSLNRNARLQQENHFLSLQQERYENLCMAIEEARQARHDIRHHLVLPQLSVFCFQWVYFCDKILVSIKGGK